MKKLLLGIFISIGAFFLMSHNASAANFSYNMNDYDWITSVNLGTQYCAYSYNTFGSSPSICILNANNPNMYGLKSYNLAHEKGDLAEFYIGVQSNVNGASTERNWGTYFQNLGAIDDNFSIIGIETVTDQQIATNFFGYWGCSAASQDSQYGLWDCSTDTGLNFRQTYYAYIIKVTILWTTKGSNPVGVKALNANTPIATCKLDTLAGSGAQCQIRMFGYTQWGYKGSSVNKEQSEATQNAVDDSETSGSNSQNSSQGATNSLLSVFTGFANVITNASATNCVINAPLNTTFSSDRLNVDLCGLSLPPAIGALTSIIAVMVVVPFAISMFNKFIGIMQGFQR